MNILLAGSGGRESAFAWLIQKSPLTTQLFIAPGNGGTSAYGTNVSLDIFNHEEVKYFVIENKIDFVIIGPEDPLANGIVDFFRGDEILKNIPILGPAKQGAMLESSKDFAKEFMQKYNIPTAAYRTLSMDKKDEAEVYIGAHSLPIVMKADGLAAGKGVSICTTTEDALQYLEEVWGNQKFGASGNKVVVEEFLSGIEASVFVLTDGKNYVIMPEAKDYKRIGDGDTGANTGGMGTVSPVDFYTGNFAEKVKEKIIIPTISGIAKEGLDYRGFVFIGLINVGGEPYVIEYNVRMGDPETEVVLPRIKSDFLPLMLSTAKGNLDSNAYIETDPNYAVAVIATSGGYPDAYEKNKEIKGLGNVKGSFVFHAGTKKDGGNILTSGGRVLAMVSMAETLEEARSKSYQNLKEISYDGMYYRKDIGEDLLRMKTKI